MGKALIITEKPSVARDIANALGGFTEKNKGEYYENDDYVCTYAVGHILTLFAPEDISPEYKRWRLTDLPIIPQEFQIKPVPSQENRVKAIARLAARSDVDRLINACDAAREGELIFREIINYLKINKPVQRLWLQSMVKKAIKEGFERLENGEKFDGLGHAAECRAYADWLIGMNATRALTVRLKSRNERGLSWSAGRVQTPTLSLLVDREIEVLEHRAMPYWKVNAKFSATDHEYEGIWFDPAFKNKDNDRDLKEDRIFDEERALRIQAAVAGQAGTAREVRKPSPRKPPLLFDLTTLQRTANSRFGWSATRTLRAAQRCYETHKVLTYPRTSSKVLPEGYKEEVDRILGILSKVPPYAPHAAHLINKGRLNDDKVFDDAGVTDHFAIIPTGEVSSLEGDDLKLYDLVTRQFMAAFYPPSVYEDVERITEVVGHLFKSKPPKVLKEAGWEAVFDKQVGQGEETNFPPLARGKDKVDNVPIKGLEAEAEKLATKPPPRISEAGLLSLMENAGRQVEDESLASALNKAEGLGTAATRADIIENLKTREYVGKTLRPTVKGIRLIDILHRIGASRLTSAELTAKLEFFLSEVEDGKRLPNAFMSEIAEYTKEVVDQARDFDFDSIYPDQKPLGSCPKCHEEVFERAWFYGCRESTKRAGKKNCDFLIWKDHNGRYINRAVVQDLLEKGKTEELDGFISANGTSYKAILALENGQLVRRNVLGSEESPEGFEVNPEPIGACPIHQEDCRVVETAIDFVCETKLKARKEGDNNAAGFSFPRMLCKREVKRTEFSDYLLKKETEFLNGFISKKGRPFSAKLQMNEGGGGFTFVFPERTPKAKKSKDAGGGEEEAVTKAGEEEKVEKATIAAKKTKSSRSKASAKTSGEIG